MDVTIITMFCFQPFKNFINFLWKTFCVVYVEFLSWLNKIFFSPHIVDFCLHRYI